MFSSDNNDYRSFFVEVLVHRCSEKANSRVLCIIWLPTVCEENLCEPVAVQVISSTFVF
jgi:hypothetical protein